MAGEPQHYTTPDKLYEQLVQRLHGQARAQVDGSTVRFHVNNDGLAFLVRVGGTVRTVYTSPQGYARTTGTGSVITLTCGTSFAVVELTQRSESELFQDLARGAAELAAVDDAKLSAHLLDLGVLHGS